MDLKTITDLVDDVPFKKFTVELENGRRATLHHSENIHFIPNRTKLWEIQIYDDEKDLRVIFHPSAVTALVTDRGDGNA